MSGWLYFIAYLLGIVPSLRWSARRLLDCLARGSTDKYDLDFERPYALSGGVIFAILWPIGLPLWFLWSTVRRLAFPNGLKTKAEEDEERYEKEQEELNRLRKLAREHNLPGWEE